jgi:parallel beta-helix repeat protein
MNALAEQMIDGDHSSRRGADCPGVDRRIALLAGLLLLTLLQLHPWWTVGPRADEAPGAPTAKASDVLDSHEEAIAAAIAADRVLWVAPDGNDVWSGRVPLPQGGDVGPLASLGAALAAVRLDPTVDTIVLADGSYFMKQALHLGSDDAGLTIAAAPGATPVLHGGLDLSGVEWTAVGDGSYTTRIDTTGLPRGVLDLHVAGVRQIAARFPNATPGDPTTGWLFAAPGTSGHETLAFHPGDVPDGIDTNELDLWVTDKFQWASNTVSVAAIDHTTGVIHLADNVPWHQVGEGSRYFFFGSRDLLDTPREWSFDAATGLLHFMPPDPAVLDSGSPIVAATTDSLIEIAGTSDVTIHGLTLRDASPHGGDRNYDYLQIGGGAIKVMDAEAVTLAGNRIANVGVGITLLDVENVSVVGNTIEHTAGNGIFLGMAWGGRGSSTVGIEGNTIRNVGHTFIESAGVQFQGTRDSRITGNLIEGAAQFGVHGVQNRDPALDPLLGNVIEGNIIRDVNYLTADGGGIKLYAGMRGGAVGNIIRDNWIDGVTHLMSSPDGSFFAADDWQDSRWPQPVAAGLYLDWNIEDTLIQGNLVTNSYGGVLLVNSDDNIIEGNVVFGGHGAAFEVADQPASDRAPMAGNIFRGNVAIRDAKTSAAVRIYDPTGGPPPARFEGNVYFGQAVGSEAFLVQGRGWNGDLRGDITAWNRHGDASGNEVLADPGFRDPAALDFALEAGSPLTQLGVEAPGRSVLALLGIASPEESSE